MDPRRRTVVLETAMRTATIELHAQREARPTGASAFRSGQAAE
jgi:hypothetical protein